MAFVELKRSDPNFERYRDKFLRAKAVMAAHYGPEEQVLAEVREAQIHDHDKPEDCRDLNDGTRYRLIAPQDIIHHLGSQAANETDPARALSSAFGTACFHSPRPPAGFRQWDTCIGRGFSDPPKGLLKIYQDEKRGGGLASPDIIQITGALAYADTAPDKQPLHITMILGDVDGNGLEDVALFAANGAFRVYLSTKDWTDEERLPRYREVDLFNAPNKVPPPPPPPVKVPAPTVPGTQAT